MAGRTLLSDRLHLWVFLAYGIFLLGFFFFPERSIHYKFYYFAVLLPGLFIVKADVLLLWGRLPFRLLMLWLVYQLLSSFWSPDFDPLSFLELAWWWLQVVMFLLLTATLLRNYPQEFDLLIRVLLIGVVLLALVSFFQWYERNPFPYSRLKPFGRIDNAILAGCAYGVFALIALHYLHNAGSVVQRLVYGLAFLVLVSAVLLTHSRTAIGGLLIALFFMFACIRGRTVLLISGIFASALIVIWFAFPDVFDRFHMTLQLRPLIWQSVLERITEAPWFGYGYLSDTSVLVEGDRFQHAHSSYLGFLRDGGIVGLVLFLLLIFAFLQQIFRQAAGCGTTAF